MISLVGPADHLKNLTRLRLYKVRQCVFLKLTYVAFFSFHTTWSVGQPKQGSEFASTPPLHLYSVRISKKWGNYLCYLREEMDNNAQTYFWLLNRAQRRNGIIEAHCPRAVQRWIL